MKVMISFGVTTEINSRLLTETMTNTTAVVQYNSTEVHGNWFSNCFDMYLTDMPKPQLHNGISDFYDYAELRVRPKGCIASQ